MTPKEFLTMCAGPGLRTSTVNGSFEELCALVVGFNLGRQEPFLADFHRWLGEQFGRPELAFSAQVRRRTNYSGARDLLVQLLGSFFEEHGLI